MTDLRVSEVFGPTIQGEGPSAGTTAIFVRLWGCNLDCSWCDTPYTWDTKGKLGVVYDRDEESKVGTVEEVVNEVRLLDPGHTPLVVITGGEPLVQAAGVVELALALAGAGYRVEVETNGTRPVPEEWRRSPWWLSYNVSPKLGHADTRPADAARVDEWASQPRAALKFVVRTADDLAEVDALLAGTPHRPWIMPEGRSAAAIIDTARAVAPEVIRRGWSLSLRAHVLLWGDERGV